MIAKPGVCGGNKSVGKKYVLAPNGVRFDDACLAFVAVLLLGAGGLLAMDDPINPVYGDVAGGTVVTIKGTNITAGATVAFDGVAATNVTVVSSTELTCTTPAHVVGPVDVMVTSAGANLLIAGAFAYREVAEGGLVWGFSAQDVFSLQRDVVAVAAGYSNTVALRGNGSVVVWGSAADGIRLVPSGAQNDVKSIATGLGFVVALRRDGSVVAWGRNLSGQCTVPAEAQSGVTAVAAGDHHSVALKADGSVIAWGANWYGECTVPPGAKQGVVAIAAGEMHTVALMADGSVMAWGANYSGQCTVPAGAQSDVRAIAAGALHTVALKNDGSVLAWGWDNAIVVPPEAQSGVVAIAGGDQHTVALKDDGSVIAWGGNEYGQCTVPTDAQSGVTAIAAGYQHTVALKSDGSVVAWGDNEDQQCNWPVGLSGGLVAIAGGYAHTVVLKQDGSVAAWGWNDYGQSTVPTEAQTDVAAIAAGYYHTVVLKRNGSVIVWGANDRNQCAVPESARSGVKAIAAGSYHTLALKLDGSVVAWGDNFYGQCTVPPEALSGVTGISAGDSSNLILKGNGSAFAWGKWSWVPPEAQSEVKAVSVGREHEKEQMLALKRDGSVFAWNAQHGVPPEVQSGVLAIATGGEHSVALRSNGAAFAWGGSNYNGECTVPVVARSNVTTVTAGAGHSAVLLRRKVPATVRLNNLTQIYDGKPKYVSSTTTPGGLVVNYTYNGSDQAPTEAGSYSVVATISSWTYQGSTTGTLNIIPFDLALTGIAPDCGDVSGGDEVTLSGSQFVSEVAVTFGGTPATNVEVVNDNMIVCRTPAHAVGAVDVSVTTANGSVTLPLAFTYVDLRDNYVDDDNPAGDDVDGDDQFVTVGGAVMSVNEFGNVHVADGDYPENVVIERSLALYGDVENGGIDSLVANGFSGAMITIQPGSQTEIGRLHIRDYANLYDVELRCRVRGFATAGVDYDQIFSSTGSFYELWSQLRLDIEGLRNQCGTCYPVDFATVDAGFYGGIVLENNAGQYVAYGTTDAANGDVRIDLMCPPDTMTVSAAQTSRPLFNWDAVSGIDAYEVRVVNDYTGEVLNNTNALPPYRCPVDLTPSWNYRWYVRTRKDSLFSEWKQGPEFTIVLPCVSVVATDASASEPGTDTGTFTVTRTGSTDEPLTVSFLVSGSATGGTDYKAIGSSLTIPAGQTSATVTVTPINDTQAELDEEVILSLIADSQYTVIEPSSAVVTIADNETPRVLISATDAMASEPGTDTGTFTITRLGNKTAALNVNFIVSGTATSGTDFTALVSPVTIPAGAASATVSVTPLDDQIVENDETVVVTLAAGTGYTVGATKTATVKIVDDEQPIVTVAATDATASEPGANTGTFKFTRMGNKTAALDVNFIVNGTAISGTDFTALVSQVTIPAGAASVTLKVTPLDDQIVENDETVVVTLAAGTGYSVGAAKKATLKIVDDEEPIVTVSAADATASEPGTNTGTFKFTRLGNKTAALNVSFTVSGTATSGTDFTALVSPVTIPAGAASVTMKVTPLNDEIVENDETVVVTLEAGAGYTVGATKTATVKIVDDEQPIVTVAAMASEPGTNTGTFTFTRLGNKTAALNVNFTVSGTATSGTDFTALVSPVTIPAGASSATRKVTPRDDLLVENGETVIVTLEPGTGYTVGVAGTDTVTIVDNE